MEIEISTKSTIYRFLRRWHAPYVLENNDRCDLGKMVLSTIFKLFTFGLLISLTLYGMVLVAMWKIFDMDVVGLTLISDLSTVLGMFSFLTIFVVLVVILSIVIVGVTVDGFKWLFGLNDRPKKPSVVKELYRSWKDKYCPRVVWVEED